MLSLTRLFLICFVAIAAFTACETEDVEPMEVDMRSVLHEKKVGASAEELLSDKYYSHLEVEIQYVQGYEPTSEAVTNLKSFLQERLNKASITFKNHSIPSPNQQTYSADDIFNIEKEHRTVYSREDTMGIYFFFADGEYSGNSGSSKVLGIAYLNTSMALFEETIKEFSDDLDEPERKTLETVVMKHEAGHILGLVNNGTSMQTPHQDEEHGHHCNNENCLMYYTAETGGLVNKLVGGGSAPTLGQECIDDLQANGGK